MKKINIYTLHEVENGASTLKKITLYILCMCVSMYNPWTRKRDVRSNFSDPAHVELSSRPRPTRRWRRDGKLTRASHLPCMRSGETCFATESSNRIFALLSTRHVKRFAELRTTLRQVRLMKCPGATRQTGGLGPVFWAGHGPLWPAPGRRVRNEWTATRQRAYRFYPKDGTRCNRDVDVRVWLDSNVIFDSPPCDVQWSRRECGRTWIYNRPLLP